MQNGIRGWQPFLDEFKRRGEEEKQRELECGGPRMAWRRKCIEFVFTVVGALLIQKFIPTESVIENFAWALIIYTILKLFSMKKWMPQSWIWILSGECLSQIENQSFLNKILWLAIIILVVIFLIPSIDYSFLTKKVKAYGTN
ncbi:MAG: hypothetical protein PHC53_02715 [Patescibacteria group bacterium]|nr:hypothetical protein [Patescibacteria group bacterium]